MIGTLLLGAAVFALLAWLVGMPWWAGAIFGAIIGAMAALEVIRALVPFGKPAWGKLIVFDLLSRRLRELAVARDPACPATLVPA